MSCYVQYCSGGWVCKLNIKTNSAQLELELGLSLAIQKQTKSLGHKRRVFFPPPPPPRCLCPNMLVHGRGCLRCAQIWLLFQGLVTPIVSLYESLQNLSITKKQAQILFEKYWRENNILVEKSLKTPLLLEPHIVHTLPCLWSGQNLPVINGQP